MILTPGQAGDAPQAPALIQGFRANHVLADAAYDSNHIRACIADIGASAVIPCNSAQKRLIPHDKETYKARSRSCLASLPLSYHSCRREHWCGAW